MSESPLVSAREGHSFVIEQPVEWKTDTFTMEVEFVVQKARKGRVTLAIEAYAIHTPAMPPMEHRISVRQEDIVQHWEAR